MIESLTNKEATIKKATFVVAEKAPFQAYLIKRDKPTKTMDYRAPYQLMFSIDDIIVDAVTIAYRARPELNKWRRSIPIDIIRYAYQMVSQGCSSFVWDVTREKIVSFDYVVCVIENRFVRRSADYDLLFQQSLDTRMAAS